MKFIVWSPDGIPIRERPFNSRAEAEQAITRFVARFIAQGYYAGVDGRLPLDEIASHCRIEEASQKRDRIA